MKRKIKIRRKVLKESTLPPKGVPKGEPKGEPHEDTAKFPKDDGAIAFQTSGHQVDIFPSSSDPTAKESPEDIKRALSKVIKEPGLLEKVFGWVQSKFLSQPSLEVPEIEAEEEIVEPVLATADYSDEEPEPRIELPLVGGRALDKNPPKEVFFNDPMDDPDPYGRRSRLKESVDKDAKFRPLQEIARRHFKKG